MPDLFSLIKKAKKRLDGVLNPTPLVYSPSFSKLSGMDVYLKLENLQKTGSFKARGAYNKIFSLTPEEKKRGVITASSGNHAQGVAWAATLLGIKSWVVMPETTPIIKRVATRSYGANVILHGMFFDEAHKRAKEIAAEKRLAFIHPFDDELVIAGQGTIGLEILKDLPGVTTIVVPIGGGGLISGIAAALKGIRRKVRVIGVTARASSCIESLKKGYPSAAKSASAIADGIAIKKIGDKTFPIIKRYVDDCIAVSEESIAEAILKLMERKKLVTEGAGAITLAALMEGKIKGKSGKRERAVLILSGGNIDVTTLDRVIRLGLLKEGRVARFSALLKDVPGTLSGFTAEIAKLKSNILQIVHQRDAVDVPFGTARVDVIVEVEGFGHIKRIMNVLKKKGYRIVS